MRYLPRLDDAQIAEALRQNHALWSSGRSLDEHRRYNREQLERAGPELLRYVGLVDDRGELVASIKRYGLALSRGAPGAIDEVRAVGIGAVYTRDDRRREGHAERLLRAVMSEAEDLGYAAAFLYSDIDPAYYARLGFVLLDSDEHEARTIDLPRSGSLPTRLATDADVERLVELHPCAFADAPSSWRIARSAATLRYFAWRNRTGAAHLLLEGDRVVGYAIASKDEPIRDLPDLRGDALWVDELVAPGVAPDRALATVRRLAEVAGVTRVRAWLRPGRVVAPFATRPRREAHPMIALLGRRSPLSAQNRFGPAFLGSFEHF